MRSTLSQPPPAAETFRFGAYRRRPPSATLAAIRPIAARCGVTRLADVTGLDTIGIPVFQAIRPLGRSLSVSQGKGVTRVAARVSALMEAIELHHAETVAPSELGPRRAGDCAGSDESGPMDWCRGINLLSGLRTRVPHALVSMDFASADRVPVASSNGLASGNDRTEAIVSALCEVIERDAQSRWLAMSPMERQRCAIDLGSVTAPLGKRLIRTVLRAGYGIRLWSFGADHGVAAIACAIYEHSLRPVFGPVLGAGAHLDPVTALARAVTEAAQMRGTLIAGARDDLNDADYLSPAARNLSLLFEALMHGPARRDWASLDTRSSGCLERDADALIGSVERVGARTIACVDLSDGSMPLSVVKIVVPGFRGHTGTGCSTP